MIELLRYARMKKDPKAVPSVYVSNDGKGKFVTILFKRFDVSNGIEVSPEESLVAFYDLEQRLTELQAELEVVKELLALKTE